MSTILAEHPVAKSKKRNDKAVKIARDLATKAKVIAESKGISAAEYLSDILRPKIEKDWPGALRAIDEQPEDS